MKETLKLFTKKDCPKCPEAENIVGEFEKKFNVERWDVGTVDGLAEAAFYGVMATPSVIVLNKTGQVAVGWRGRLPEIEVLKTHTEGG